MINGFFWIIIIIIIIIIGLLLGWIPLVPRTLASFSHVAHLL